jgi:hypothetical protein
MNRSLARNHTPAENLDRPNRTAEGPEDEFVVAMEHRYLRPAANLIWGDKKAATLVAAFSFASSPVVG